MKRVFFVPRFVHSPRQGPAQHCGLEVFADAEHRQVKVVLHVWSLQHLKKAPHLLANSVYRQVLFRLLNPASWVHWFCCTDGVSHQAIALEGLPGGYTGGQVAGALSLPGRARQAAG